MERYESKQYRIRRPASQVYALVSDFSNFTPILQDRVEGWQADRDTCSFRVQGFSVGLRIVERRENELVKVEGQDGSPMEFTFWVQLKQVDEYDTRMRLVLDVKLNMMMKMMIGGKLQEGLDKIAAQVADAFNGVMPEGFDPSSFAADIPPQEEEKPFGEEGGFDFILPPDPDKPVS